MSLIISLICLVLNVNSETAYKAYFTPDVTGVDGWVSISRQRISMSLNLTGSSIDEACYDLGLSYHLHYWNQSAIGENVNESTASCGFDYTQNHYDPWAACGGASNNQYCTRDAPNGTTCIPTSAYNCEVGDWSNKYGTLTMNDTTGLYMTDEVSFWEVSSLLLGNNNGPYSIVFHCASSDQQINGNRALCGLLQAETVTDDRMLPNQTSMYDYVMATFDTFGLDNYIKIMSNGDISAKLDISSSGIPDITDCSNGYSIGIYNSWNSDAISIGNGTECGNVVGWQYDPSNHCWDYYSDSQYCDGNMLCGDTGYSYSCSSNGFDCSPSDLTGRYMYDLMIDGSTAIDTMIDTSNILSLMSPIDMLVDKSIVIYCPDSDGLRGKGESIYACAKITGSMGTTSMDSTMTPDTTMDSTMTPDTTMDNNAVIFTLNSLFFIFFVCMI